MAGIVTPIREILQALNRMQVINQTGVSAPLTARVWNDQIRRNIEGEIEYQPYPAAFLEITTPSTYAEIGGGIGASDLVFAIHLAHEYYDAMDGTFEQDLLIFELRDQLLGTLSHFKPTGCGPLSRISESQDYAHANIYHYIVEFTAHFIDDRGSNDITQGFQLSGAPLDLEINPITVEKSGDHQLSQQKFNINGTFNCANK